MLKQAHNGMKWKSFVNFLKVDKADFFTIINRNSTACNLLPQFPVQMLHG
jgi:hypothetical protein